MIIKNFAQLSISENRRLALEIAEAGLEAINTTKVIKNCFRFDNDTQKLTVKNQEFNLANYKKVICIGFGKVALEAVSEIQNQLGDRINCGFVIDLKEGRLGNIVCRIGSHPYPTIVNVEATEQLLSMLSDCSKEDLIICVVGGGGSSLLCSPKNISCEQEIDIIRDLTKKGAAINELNTVRKHISNVKGGNLAQHCYPATVISMIFSDVPGNDLSQIASGPTVLDTTTVQDARNVMDRYDLIKDHPEIIRQLSETPKDPELFNHVYNILLISPELALDACKAKAIELGLPVHIYNTAYQGEARELGPLIIRAAGERTGCWLGSGESTVKVVGSGQGGRNQELALAALPYIAPGQVLITLASDGYDNSPRAGALIDDLIQQQAIDKNLNINQYLNNNDSYNFFTAIEGGIESDITGSNISDFFVLLNNQK